MDSRLKKMGRNLMICISKINNKSWSRKNSIQILIRRIKILIILRLSAKKSKKANIKIAIIENELFIMLYYIYNIIYYKKINY